MEDELSEEEIARRIKIVWIIFCLVMLPLVSYIIGQSSSNIDEGYWAVYFAIMNFISILFCLAIGVWALFRIHPDNHESVKNFLINLGGIWVFFFIVWAFFSDTKDRDYYAIFENKKTVITDNYALSYIAPSRSSPNYFLHIGKNGENDFEKGEDKVQINETTYKRLRVNIQYNLNITYKPKAEILYDLQILSK